MTILIDMNRIALAHFASGSVDVYLSEGVGGWTIRIRVCMVVSYR